MIWSRQRLKKITLIIFIYNHYKMSRQIEYNELISLYVKVYGTENLEEFKQEARTMKYKEIINLQQKFEEELK